MNPLTGIAHTHFRCHHRNPRLAIAHTPFDCHRTHTLSLIVIAHTLRSSWYNWHSECVASLFVLSGSASQTWEMRVLATKQLFRATPWHHHAECQDLVLGFAFWVYGWMLGFRGEDLRFIGEGLACRAQHIRTYPTSGPHIAETHTTQTLLQYRTLHSRRDEPRQSGYLRAKLLGQEGLRVVDKHALCRLVFNVPVLVVDHPLHVSHVSRLMTRRSRLTAHCTATRSCLTARQSRLTSLRTTLHISHLPSHIPHLTSHTTHHAPHTTYFTSHISHHTSHTPHHISHFTHPSSHIPHPSSHIPHPTSHIPHPTSHISHLTSHISHLRSHITCKNLLEEGSDGAEL
eukprot:336837-Rhodomonas_salina.1